MMIKRIIYRQRKQSELSISSAAYLVEMARTRSAPPVAESISGKAENRWKSDTDLGFKTAKNKKLKIVLSDGTELTEEMIKNLSVSSDEESSDGKEMVEMGVGSQNSSQFGDQCAMSAQNTEDLAKYAKQVPHESDIEPEQFQDTTEKVDVSQVKDEDIQPSISPEPPTDAYKAALDVESLEVAPQSANVSNDSEGLQNDSVESHANVGDPSASGGILTDIDDTTQTHVFQSPQKDDHVAVLAERDLVELNDGNTNECLQEDASDKSSITTEGAQKESKERLDVYVPSMESALHPTYVPTIESNSLPTYMPIVLKPKPSTMIRRKILIRDIFGCKERKPVVIKYGCVAFGRKVRSEVHASSEPPARKNDVVQAFKLELNRVAPSNVDSVISSIKSLNVKTRDEMDELSKIMFEKAVSETLFLNLYIKIVKDIYKVFKCDEENIEKKDGKGHTVFFTNLCKMGKLAFMNKENWSSTVEERDLTNITEEERIKYENELEEMEAIKFKKRTKVMGTIRFLSGLYNAGVISSLMINLIIKSLTSSIQDGESVEILCVLLDSCGEKLARKDSRLLNEGVQLLKGVKDKLENRIRFMVMDLFEIKIPKWRVSSVRPMDLSNRFSSLRIEEKKKPQVESVDLNSLFKILVSESSNHDEFNESTGISHVLSNINEQNSSKFVDTFMMNIIESLRNSDVERKINILVKVQRIIKADIDSRLANAKCLIDDSVFDAPFSLENFFIMLCVFRSESIISKETFESYSCKELKVVMKNIISSWMHDSENLEKIQNLASDEDAKVVLEDLIKKEGADSFTVFIKRYGISAHSA